MHRIKQRNKTRKPKAKFSLKKNENIATTWRRYKGVGIKFSYEYIKQNGKT